MMYDSLKKGDLEAICSILEDEINKNQLAYDFIASCFQDVIQLKCIRKNKLQVSDSSKIIVPSYATSWSYETNRNNM